MESFSQKSELDAALHHEFFGLMGDANGNVQSSSKPEKQQQVVAADADARLLSAGANAQNLARDFRDGVGLVQVS